MILKKITSFLVNKASLVYSSFKDYSKETLESMDFFSERYKTLIEKEKTISTKQANRSIPVSHFLEIDNEIEKDMDFFAKKCRDLTLSKTQTVSSSLY